ncbi:AAA family ATPase [uncultured Agrobacterium sp.]|uniref:AAA family ATPase n=1 Tax=uncultured Agrobacterium sp. TaxID=157277 RepID=UPI0025EFF922|nr:AAA family ATPase [uncultured Agrobacterium sp.]
MARRQHRVDFERTLARLHVDRILDDLGVQPAGIHVVIVPSTAMAAIWQDAAVMAIADTRVARGLSPVGGDRFDVEEVVDGPAIVAPEYDVFAGLLRWDRGIDSGLEVAACSIYFADVDEENSEEHVSVALADSLCYIELDIDLVILAAAQCGRKITADDAILLAKLPWRRRRIALASSRPISETYKLHMQAQAAEEERKAKEAEKKDADKKSKKRSERVVPDVRPLSEMHGYGDAQAWGVELAKDIEDWRKGVISWSDVDNGILLSGPPGCGKTTFASALARSLDAHLVVGSYAGWLGTGDGHQGDLIKSMRMAFAEACEYAPTVLLIDEIDNFIARGSIGNGKADEWNRGVVNALLECLDGATAREGVIVVGATNDPSGIDAALRRPGRLDRHVQIGLPDEAARLAILRQHLRVDDDFPLNLFKRKTEGMSGADLERLARDARRLARRERREVRPHHIASALPRRERRSDESIRHIATHEIGHAVVAAVLGATVLEVYVNRDRDPNSDADVAGAAVVQPRDGRRDFPWFVDRVAHIMGGLSAERMVYGTHSDGAIADLSEATNLMTYAFASVGMGETLASDGQRDPIALMQARQFDPILRRRVEDVMKEQAERARAILECNREAFGELVEALITRGRLDGSVVHETLQACGHPQLALAI